MLTQEQKQRLQNDKDFKSLVSGTKVEYEATPQTAEDRIAELRAGRMAKQGAPMTPEEEGVKGLAGVAVGAGKGIVSTLTGASSLGEKMIKGLGRLITPKSMEKSLGFEKTEKTSAEELVPENIRTAKGGAEKLGFGAEQIGEFFIPGAVGLKAPKTLSLLSRAGIAGIESGAITAAQTGEVGKEAGIATIGGSLLSGAGSLVGKGLESLPNRLVQSAIKQAPKELKSGKDITEYVLKTKSAKTANSLLDESQTIMSDLNTKISNNLKSVKITEQGGKISPSNILKEVTDKINSEGGSITTKEVKSIIDGLAPQVKGTLNKPTLNLLNANSLRSNIDKTLGDRAFFSQQNTFNKNVLMDFANTLRETVKSKAPEGTRKLFEDLSSEIRFSKALGDKVFKQQGNQIFSFGDIIGGGAGAAVGGPVGAIVGAAARRGLQSTPALIGGAKVIDAITKAEPIISKLSSAEQGILSQLIQSIIGQEKE